MPFFQTNKGVKIHYETKGFGTPIIFIHPPLLDSANFHYQLSNLSRAFQVIVFDIRDHGKSAMSDEPITYKLIVNDIIQLLDHLRIKQAWIAGYSTGGSIALEFFMHYAHRALGGVLISAMSEVNDWKLKREIQLGVFLAKKQLKNILSYGIAWSNSDCWDTYRRLLAGAQKSQLRAVEQYYRYSISYQCTDQLAQIKQPILLLYGKNDSLFYPYAKLLKNNLSDVQCKWVEDTRHQLPTKAYQTIHPWIQEFIQDHQK